MDARTLCKHPANRSYAWWIYDHVLDADVLCMGCCLCGDVLCGAVDEKGKSDGPQKVIKQHRKGRTHASRM